MNLIMRVIHAVPLYVHIVIDNYRWDGFNVVTSLTHWWRQEVYTITDFKKYMLCEHIKEFSGWYGPRRRYHHTEHSLAELEDIMFEVEEDLRREANLKNNGLSIVEFG